MKLGLVTVPSRSHLGMLAPLAELAGSGSIESGSIQAVLITGDVAAGDLDRLGLPYVTDPRLNIDFDRRDPMRKPFRQQILNRLSLEDAVDALRAIICTQAIDCLVTDCHFAAPLAAQLEGVRSSCVLQGPAWLMDGADLWRTSLRSEIECLADFCRRRDLDMPTLSPIPRILAQGQSVSCFGTASLPTFLPSPPCIDVDDVRFVGLPIARRALGVVTPRDIDVVLTFGSLPVPDARMQSSLAALRGCGLTVGITAESVPPGFGWVKPLGFGESLRQLVSGAAVVVHHGGIASTLETMWAGCPAIVWPAYPHTDQPVNGYIVERAGVGTCIDSEDELRDCVELVLNDEGYRRRAARLSADLRAVAADGWWKPLLVERMPIVNQQIAGRIVHGGRVSAVAVRGESGEELGGRIVLLDALQVELVLLSIVHGAVGVIARQGGVASHGAALLREAGVPTLTAVDFPEGWSGRHINLDGNVGMVGPLNDRS